MEELRSGVSFSPAHVSGFFSIHDDPSPLKTGSIGAGICLDKGVKTEVVISKVGRYKDKDIEVYINGSISDAPVTRMTAERLLPKGHSLMVKSTVELPISQGFGMSGAGALSTALAIADSLGIYTRQEAIETAHETEVRLKTGLGDVAAQSKGGIVIRLKPGIPPFGEVGRIGCVGRDVEILIGAIGEPMLTRDIIMDERRKLKINEEANRVLSLLKDDKSIENLFRLSYQFAFSTGLISEAVRKGVERAMEHGLASMAMLGNSLFAMGDLEKIERSLLEIGAASIQRCSIDWEGARYIA